MKKFMALLMTLVLVCSAFCVFPVSAEGNKFVMMPHQSPNGSDGGWWASGISNASSYGDEGLDITMVYRSIWAVPDSIANKYPYLYLQIESGADNMSRLTATHMWHAGEENQKDIDYTDAIDGVLCVNLFELLKGEDSPTGYLYIAPYVDGRVVFSKFYLSDIDPDGNVYTPPTQPRPMWNNGGTMLRYDLPAYADGDHTEEVDGKTYGWLMVQPDGSIPMQITEHEDGKGFYMERKEDFENVTAANIAYVVPYEQLEKTPYLIVDISNEGRPDEGPQVSIFAYWESVVGSAAYFDGMEKAVAANSLNGVRAYNLKYAVDNVKEELHGENGIAIIVALDWSQERTNGTCMDPLMINDVYLTGWEGGAESDETLQDHLNRPTTTTTTSALTAADNAEGGSEFPILPVAIAAGAVVIVAAVVVIVLKKKK